MQISPEFTGRIDNVVPFRPLQRESLDKIMWAHVNRWCAEQSEKHKIALLTVKESFWEPELDSIFLMEHVRW